MRRQFRLLSDPNGGFAVLIAFHATDLRRELRLRERLLVVMGPIVQLQRVHRPCTVVEVGCCTTRAVTCGETQRPCVGFAEIEKYPRTQRAMHDAEGPA